LAVPLIGATTTALAPKYRADDLTVDWASGPYLGHNPGGLSYEGGYRLLRYNFSDARLAPGDALIATLYWDARADGLTAQVSLEGMAGPLFNVPDVLAVSASPIAGGHSEHRLQIPPTLPPGAYLIGVHLLAGGAELRPLDDNDRRIGQTYLQPVRVTGPAQLPPTASLDIPFGPDVRLRDAQAEQSAPGRLVVALAWTADRQLPQNYAVSVRLLDSSGTVLSQHDGQPNYGFSPTALWAPGEPVLDRYFLDLPPGLSPDEDYSLQVVLYDPVTLAAVGMATVPGVWLTLVDVRATYPILAVIGPGWALSALELDKTEAWQGERVSIRATWAALQQTAGTYTLRLQLRDSAGQTVWESQSILNEKPLPANALLSRRHFVDVPLHLARGAYCFAFTIEDVSGKTVGTYLHPIPFTIRERERTFSVPEMGHRANVYFGEEIALLGYDLRQDGESLRLTLHWQAQTRPAADRKVFVHLFDPKTEQIPAQWDSQPREGKYPTTQWAAGEVVSEEITLSLKDVPAGAYRLAVGLYGPAPAGRMKAVQLDGKPLPNDRYVLAEGIAVR
jgi:hypothetical protein